MATISDNASPRNNLGDNERFWGYLFIAAPLIGFFLFTALPLFGSLALSLTDWDLLTDPEWVGLENWETLFSVKVAHLPQLVDEETGEKIFQCGRDKIPESRLGDYEGEIDPRTRTTYVCEPELKRVRDVFPRGYKEAFAPNIFGRQYIIAAKDEIFWKSLYNTFFMILGIPVSLFLSLMLAIALNQGIAGARFFRTLYYIPTILPIAALALIWLWILNPDYGLLNYSLDLIGLDSMARTNWLQNKNMVKPALIMMTIWKGLGYQMIIYLAGLQGIQRQLYEAAEIDGAGFWAKFKGITWPGLTPTTFFLLVTSLIATLQIFQEPAIMTNGGPYFASTTTVMLIWQNAFRDFQMGYAATQAWVLGAIIMAITALNFVLAKRWVFYE